MFQDLSILVCAHNTCASQCMVMRTCASRRATPRTCAYRPCKWHLCGWIKRIPGGHPAKKRRPVEPGLGGARGRESRAVGRVQVEGQGELLDRVEHNVESAKVFVGQGVDELRKVIPCDIYSIREGEGIPL